MSNFLGDAFEPERSPILSSAELIEREGVELHKSMNFRDDGLRLSVFLVLESKDPAWDAKQDRYAFEGHDSTTVESGKLTNQVLMYESGALSDNGKFYKAAHEYKDGLRQEPLQVQVYEKLDSGVWFDKGIFELIDAAPVKEGGRAVFEFYLRPAGEKGGARMISAAHKRVTWERARGRCETCGTQADLYFEGNGERLLCGVHCGRQRRGFLG